MDEKTLFRVASKFLKLTKKANNVRINMAKRIMFSLLAHLVPAGESFRIAATKGAVDPKVLKQMIPGAKELIEYGTEASISEARYHISFKKKEGPVYQKINEAIAADRNKDYKTSLIILTDVFKNENWQPYYGGKNWARITETLLSIQNHLDAAIEAKKSSDWDKEIEELMAMTAYMNVLDGLAHNSGSIMPKILDSEKNKKNLPHDYKYNEDVSRLMDVKEFKDPNDVLHEILPVLEKSDAPLTMKDWIHKAREKRFENNDPEKREKALTRIRLKKTLMGCFTRLEVAEKKIKNLYLVPDNFLINHFILLRFYSILEVAELGDVLRQNKYSSLLPYELNKQIGFYCDKLFELCRLNEDAIKNKLKMVPAKDFIFEYADYALSLINLFRKATDSLTE